MPCLHIIYTMFFSISIAFVARSYFIYHIFSSRMKHIILADNLSMRLKLLRCYHLSYKSRLMSSFVDGNTHSWHFHALSIEYFYYWWPQAAFVSEASWNAMSTSILPQPLHWGAFISIRPRSKRRISPGFIHRRLRKVKMTIRDECVARLSRESRYARYAATEECYAAEGGASASSHNDDRRASSI